jgi:hypothetical protein
MRELQKIFLALAGSMIALACAGPLLAEERPAYSDVLFLNQGWTEEDRLLYYNLSQGSAAMSYDIFLNLEVPNSQTLFRADENMARYGLLPQPSDPKYNPDGLPIGVSKTVVNDGRWKGEWVGLGCAACHNGQLEYKGTKIRISGGNANTLDILGFIQGLDDALAATVADPEKFTRLAEKLGKNDDAGKEGLRRRLQQDAEAINRYRSRTALTPIVVGPGRMDALGLIHNQVQSNTMGVPENWRAALAPVKPSFCWNVPQSAWAQWSGVLKDPILRNLGEVMGVFAKIDLTSKSPEDGLFESTVDLKGQMASEDLLRRLAPPKWPEEILGKIDQEKATKGQQLFAENCATCHSTWPHRWSEPKKEGKRFIENAIVPVDLVGTDPTQFGSPQFESKPTVMAGPLSNYLRAPYTGAAVVPPPAVFETAQLGVFDGALSKLSLSEEDLVAAHGYRAFYPEALEPVPALFAYKANPAEGMWASPPYLHNGSVPNLYELLSPAKERSQTFYIGREFDPVKVGVDMSGKSGTFMYDTSLVGNANTGHSFEDGPPGKGVIGRLLTDDERWALIEYMKSIPNLPGQITPFGGPSNPVRAWEDKTFFHIRNPGTYNGAPKLAAAPAGTSVRSALAQETIEPDEKELIDEITKASLDRLRSQFPPGTGPVLRDAHPKAHGLVRAQFIVLDGLPPELRFGVFKTPHTFDALIRFSAGNVEVQEDTVPQAAGMAIKLLGVDGEKLLENEKDAKTQDFIMINAPIFFVRNLKDYVLLHEDMAKGQLKEFFRTRPAETNAIKIIRGQQFFNPLQVRYWSMTPYLLGDRAIKFSATPLSRNANLPPEQTGPNFLREAMMKQVGAEDVYFEFGVQFQSDPLTMPVEDPLVMWDEAVSPFQRVAIIRIPKQDISAKSWVEFAENLSFTPWHSLPEHRPLGSNNRARRAVYEAISEFRHERNGVPRQEPTEIPR